MKSLREHPAGLGRYLGGAVAARTADEGLAPALVLLVAATGRDPVLAGLLLGAAGVPHVVAGPVAGAVLDAAPRRPALLALGMLVFGAALVAVAALLGRVPDAVVVGLAACAGCAGPLLAGGLSAELSRGAGAGVPPPRALALDGASYGAAALAGPAAVGACTALLGARAATAALGLLAAVAAALVLRLPAGERPSERQASWRGGLAGARRLWSARGLRRATLATTVAFAGLGALPLVAITRAGELGSTTAGAALLTAMAAGGLLGALGSGLVAGGPERCVLLALLVLAAAFGAAAAAPGLLLLAVALAVAGVADGALLAAVLAVRTAHSEPAERGAVFTTAASLKIAAGAAGAAGGGVLVAAAGASAGLLAVAGLHLLGALVAAGALDVASWRAARWPWRAALRARRST